MATSFGGDTKSAKPAQLVASAVTVMCPHCDAIQPAPDNSSDMWLPDQIAMKQDRQPDVPVAQKRHQMCTSCQKPYYFRNIIMSVRMP